MRGVVGSGWESTFPLTGPRPLDVPLSALPRLSPKPLDFPLSTFYSSSGPQPFTLSTCDFSLVQVFQNHGAEESGKWKVQRFGERKVVSGKWRVKREKWEVQRLGAQKSGEWRAERAEV